MSQKYTDAQYLDAELFQDRDIEIRCLTRKMVITRKPQRCAFGDAIQQQHEIPPKTKAICERAIVEGQWGSCYSCLPCVDTWLDEILED